MECNKKTILMFLDRPLETELHSRIEYIYIEMKMRDIFKFLIFICSL